MDQPLPLVVLLLIALPLAGLALFVWVVAGRTADGRLGRESGVGIRAREVRASDEAWLLAHKVARPAVDVGCTGLLIAAVTLVLAGNTAGVVWFVVGGLVWMLVLGLVGVNQGIAAVRRPVAGDAHPDRMV
ncbi:SdpI family protein [Cellulomonas bogoriensis]|uniref:SdpI/YhfL protein family n=1 Tax=Cellulomonas bogoriensis 69B4 = DSM 16987 TaxID=1386082 RepID=A0A0A0C3C1_9CELL|nr:SdpI family protein [Cellulomonas bogoriensis]KGM13854.1 hypothetical protein N869_09085 [Cellulomonas bogoriensis 69B4 = DSM 16987]